MNYYNDNKQALNDLISDLEDGNGISIMAKEDVESELDYASKCHNLEEELGCPLDVVVRALKEGVYVLDEETGGTKWILRGFVNHTQDYEMEEFGFVDDRDWANIKDEETGLDIPIFYAWKDYKKTWWLNKEKE